MRTLQNTICILLFLLSGSVRVSAQSNTIPLRLGVDSVVRDGDTLYAFVYAGKNVNLVEGLQGTLYRSKTDIKWDYNEIGTGTVVQADSFFSFIRIRPNRGDSSVVKPGDMLSFQVVPVKRRYPNIFYDLVLQNIIFTSYATRQPFYSLYWLAKNDLPGAEKEIAEELIGDARLFYNQVAAQNEPGQVFNYMATEGRYRGLVMKKLFEKLRQEDVMNYLLYVKTYPRRYIGQGHLYIESFGGWFYSGAPYSTAEVRKVLFPVFRNKALLKQQVLAYTTAIRMENMGLSFAEEASDLFNSGQLAASKELMDFATALAEAVNDDEARAGIQLMKAQILQDDNKFPEAIIQVEKAIAICRMYNADTSADYPDFKITEIKALIKRGYCQYKISAYKAGRESLEQAGALLQRTRKQIGEDVYLFQTAKRYHFAGYFDYLVKDYASSLVNYQRAVKINDSIGTRASINTNADLLLEIGKILVSQKKVAEAIHAFEEAGSIYNGNGSGANGVSVLVQTGLAWYEAADYSRSIGYYREAYAYYVSVKDDANAGYLQSLLGLAYAANGNSDSSITAHRLALKLRNGSAYGVAYSWNQLSRLYKSTGLKTEALHAIDSSLLYYRMARDSAGVSEVLTLKGNVYQQDQQYNLAIRYLESARKAAGSASAELLSQMGDVWLQLDTAKARDLFRECLAVSRKSGNPGYEFTSNLMLAQLYAAVGDKTGSAKYFNDAVAYANGSSSGLDRAAVLGMRAYWAIMDLDPDSAIYYYQRAYEVYDSVDRFVAVDYLNRIANVHVTQGNFTRADQLLKEAAALARSIGSNLGLASTYVNASFLKILLGDVREGLALNDSALEIYGQSGNDFSLAFALSTRGGLLITAGRYADGVKSLLQADSIYRRQGTDYYTAGIWANIGVAYYNQDDFANAVKYFEKTAALNPQGMVTEDYLLTLSNLSEAYYYNKQAGKAEKLAREWLPVSQKTNFHRSGASFAQTLAAIAYEQKKYTEIPGWLEYARKHSLMGSNLSLANIYVLSAKMSVKDGDAASAEEYYRNACDIAVRYDMGSRSWISFYEAGLYYYKKGMYDTAVVRLKKAVELVEKGAGNLLGGEAGRNAYSNDVRKVEMYSMLTAALLKTKHEKEAFAYANKSNITGLQVLNGPASMQGDAGKNQALAGLGELQQKKDALEKSAASIRSDSTAGPKMLAILQQTRIVEEEYSRYVEGLVAKYPEIGLYFQRNANPDDFYNYKGELPDDMALLLYLPNGNDLMVFSLTNEELSVEVVQLKPGVNAAINAFKSLAKNRGKSATGAPLRVRSEVVDEEPVLANLNFKDVSSELYQLLVGSVESKIKGRKKICIIPNGNLSNLPFQCLGREVAGTGFRYFMEDYAVFYTNQLDMFRGAHDRANEVVKPVTSFAAFGVPDQTLRYNLDEVKTIGGIMGSDSTVYADGRATESAARASLLKKKVIHFATHGTLNYNQYSQSYLKFLPDADTSGGRDGRLTIDEIKKLLITGCDLVTLSACETAVNSQLVKGWNISPANAFLQRKVKSVVASLWKVDDEATSLLMKAFYENLGSGMEKVEALRRAQETLSKDPRYTHPYFWGAFVLFGDWK
ncbi:MAG: CHAT domain-containing protein [Chitinophagaceae bacterium]|nr:MAG: CHAT domain-containing protein [Chitinophagaceae bacterium]